MVSAMLSSILLLPAIITPILALPGSSAPFPAPGVQNQAIVERSTYIGGWPIGLDGTGGSCPSFAPVTCGGGSTSLNTQCCPSGNNCGGDSVINAYCCPSTNDCKTSVTNFPACANTTWVMYTDTNGGGFFCCEPGMIAVNPVTGWDGLCVPSDQAVPKSLLATTATQVGGGGSFPTSVFTSPSTTTPLSSQTTSFTNTEATSLTGQSSGSASSATNTRSSSAATTTPASSGSSSSSDSNTNKSSGKSGLGIGPIIGIAIGGIGLILLAGIFYALMRRRRPIQPQIQYVPTPTGVMELPPTVGRKPAPHMMATSMYSAATPGATSPGGFSQQQPPRYGEGEQRYDPPISPPPPSRTPNPYDSYAEMEGRSPGQAVELRADRTGN